MRSSLLLLVFCGTTAAGEPVRVELPDRAAVAAAVVTVADVARLSGGDPVTRTTIARLDLAELPARGDTGLTLTRRQVEFRLKLAGLAADEYLLLGADRVTVAVARRAVTADEVTAAARDALRKRLPWPAEELSVEVVQPVAAKLPEAAADEDVSITAEPHAGTVNLGRTQMDVTIRVRGERRLAVPVVLDAKLIQPVAVLLKPVQAGEPLTEQAIRVERRPVDAGRRHLSAGELVGRKVTRPLPAGHTLSAGDVEQPTATAEPPLVRTRQRVTLTVTIGAMTVSAAGEALQDGKLGQTVRVQNADSKKVLTGRVSGPGTVDIDIGGGP